MNQSSFKTQTGYVVVTILVFTGVFIVLLSSLATVIFSQSRVNRIKDASEQAFQIAEAGLDYYRWHLAHYPNDLQNGTGVEGPYTIAFEDPETDVVGEYELDIAGEEACGEVTSVELRSTGRTTLEPSVERTVVGRYARPSVAEYAYIINSNVWAGEDRTITGPYHSNGGIRMDAEHDSIVTSAQEEWLCSSSFGCSGGGDIQDGVFGDGSNPELWQFPVAPTDFVGITVDLNELEDLARDYGLYFNPAGGQSDRRGWHLDFQGDGSVNVWRVTNTQRVWGYDTIDEWEYEYHIISNEQWIGNYDIPEDCSVIFVEDKLWIEGVVDGKVTVAAAKVNQVNFDADVILAGDITYANEDGSDGLTVIAEGSVLIPLNSPENMELNGIFIAQKGKFGRNHYEYDCSFLFCSSTNVPSGYQSYIVQDTLTINGTIVSNERVGTQWTGGGSISSGYTHRINSYDRYLATSPPPFTPTLSDEYEFIEWREE